MAEKIRVLALPGLLCDAYVWERQAAELADIATFLVPGFTAEDTLEKMARSALTLCDGPVSVVGHSMGGRAAMELWRISPDRVDRLALLDTGHHPRVDGEEVDRRRLVELAQTQGMDALAREWLPPMVHADRTGDEALMAPLRAMVARKTPEIFANQQNALLTRPDAMPTLRTVTVPTLVGVGRDDRWSPVAQHEEIAAAVPVAKLVIFEDSGHMATVENAPAVTAALRNWLSV